MPGFGTNDGGIVCDLSAMRGVRVDPARRTARAEGGSTWGDLDHATHAFGLATTGGIISTTGVGGLTLGGGIGHLTRGYGLSCDNLISADVVTADGQFVIASEDENPDLFWALRGGGGNFGVVTSLEFRLHPVGEIYGGPIFYPVDAAAEVMRFYREFIAEAPEQLGAFFAFQIAPPLPFIPEERHGETMCLIVTCWAGPDRGGRARRSRRCSRSRPSSPQHVGAMPYPALNSAFDALLPAGLQHYWKADFVARAHRRGDRRPRRARSARAVRRVDDAPLPDRRRLPPRRRATRPPSRYRDARFACVIAGMWPDPADNERNIAWVRDYWEAIHPHSEPGGYVNFMAGDDQDRIRGQLRRQLRPPGRGEAALRPGQPLPDEPEHRSAAGWGRGSAAIATFHISDRRPLARRAIAAVSHAAGSGPQSSDSGPAYNAGRRFV